jgi:hypothetical protein
MCDYIFSSPTGAFIQQLKGLAPQLEPKHQIMHDIKHHYQQAGGAVSTYCIGG